MEIGKIYIIKHKEDFISIFKVYYFTEYHIFGEVVKTKTFEKGITGYNKNNYTFIDIEEFKQNPNAFPNEIMDAWYEYLKDDIVEARKWKLKLLEEYGSR